MLAFAKAKYAFTGMDTGDLRFDKDEVPGRASFSFRFRSFYFFNNLLNKYQFVIFALKQINQN